MLIDRLLPHKLKNIDFTSIFHFLKKNALNTFFKREMKKSAKFQKNFI